jgi:quercetin dioxygenase-like cupin family protein
MGCIEHLTVLDGRLEIESDGETAVVSMGDTIRYAADVEHTIRAIEDSRGLLIVKNA